MCRTGVRAATDNHGQGVTYEPSQRGCEHLGETDKLYRRDLPLALLDTSEGSASDSGAIRQVLLGDIEVLAGLLDTPTKRLGFGQGVAESWMSADGARYLPESRCWSVLLTVMDADDQAAYDEDSIDPTIRRWLPTMSS